MTKARGSIRLVLAASLLLSYTKPSQAQSFSNSNSEKSEPPKVSGPQTNITVPPGTKVIMVLISPLHTVSATRESGLYLETISDVVVENRVAIPAHTRVQGSVTRVARPGRVKGRGLLQFEFTRLILPNNYVVPMAGRLQSLPGSAHYEKKHDDRIQPVDQIDKDVWGIIGAAASGAAIGAFPLGAIGALKGTLIGSGFGLGTALFSRGEDIRLPAGTRVEMTLEHPVTLSSTQLVFPPSASTVPVSLPPEIDDSPRREPVRKPARVGWSSIVFRQR